MKACFYMATFTVILSACSNGSESTGLVPDVANENQEPGAEKNIESVADTEGSGLNLRDPPLSPKVGAGRKAERGQFPFMAAIIRSADQKSNKDINVICGAVLLTPWTVATAAHCVSKPGNTPNPANFAVLAGTLGRTPTKGKVSVVKKIFLPTTSDSRSSPYKKLGDSAYDVVYDFDLAILELSKNFQSSRDIGFARNNIPPAGSEIPGEQESEVPGWGKVTSNTQPKDLLFGKLSVLSKQRCQNAYPQGLITNRMLCAGSTSVLTCNGDSGGSLTTPGKSYQLLGITSWGYGECGENVTAASSSPYFTSVFVNLLDKDVRTWLDNTLKTIGK